jgi:ribosome maturation factor RimP
MAFAIDRVREIAERVAASNGLEVVEVELRGGGKARMLRIVIDRPEMDRREIGRPEIDRSGIDRTGQPDEAGSSGGVTHEDCANVSREVGTILDVEDAVPGGSYTLEVSSPGLDRKLTRPAEFERFVGSRIKLTTKEAVSGNRHFEGRLQRFENGRLTLVSPRAGKKRRENENGAPQVEIDFSNVEKANLVPEI